MNRLLALLAVVIASVSLAFGSLAPAWPGPDAAEKNANRWCFAWLATPPKGVSERPALLKGAKWPAASVITVSFMDGDTAVQKKVMENANKWTRGAGGPANITFDFRKDPNTDIRISFKYEGSWSVIGTTCKQVPKDQPTMNYGWLSADTPDLEYQRVVLHEFGHAIGLIHEHQNPAGGIEWDQVQVIKDLSGPPNNWTVPVISHNMFETYEAKETNFTKTDPLSIMMYPIPTKWTKNGFSAGLNSDLSEMDKSFIMEQYP